MRTETETETETKEETGATGNDMGTEPERQNETELAQAYEALKAENEALKKENKRWRDMSFSEAKESVYDKVPLTLRQMDMLIAGLVILAIVFVILGMQ